MNNYNIKFIFIICLLLFTNMLCAQEAVYEEKADTLYFSILFPINESSIDFEKGNNIYVIQQIDSIVRRYYYEENHFISSIDIMAFSSFDGPWLSNILLSERRASAIKEYLLETFPFTEQTVIHAKGMGEDWANLKRIVGDDANIPAREQVLEIINNGPSDYDQKEQRIKQLEQGATFRYMTWSTLPLLRRVDIRMIGHFQIERRKESQIIEIIEKIKMPEIIEITERIETPETPVQPFRWAVKTNLIFLNAGVANAGAEFPIGEHLSIDVPITYSPYTIARNWRLRTLSLQPEIRWWPGTPLKGHFAGFHTHLAWYNVSTDKQDRYQDKNGNTPLWGAGLSYGYDIHLKNRWNMEFTIGLGYARLNYEVFYNIDNGAVYENGIKNYWGPTRAAVNLIYQFN